jgi:hypothetical protein
VAGVVLGLPGFFGAFLSESPTQLAFAVAAGVTGLGFILGAWYVDRATGAAPFTMNFVSAELTIHDSAGKSAQLVKAYKIIPNYAHLNEIAFRNIMADGGISDLCWNDRPIPSEQIKERAGEAIVRVRFHPPLARWQEIDGKLSYKITDSFPNDTEWFGYSVDFPAKRVDLIVNLPAGRECRAARSSRIHGEEVAFQTPEIDASRRRLSLSLQKPKVGEGYTIYWDW